jgi:excisionase family DNA binding protein
MDDLMRRSTPTDISSPRPARPARERYLSIPEVAERLGTTERFPRRLVAERRIEFKRFGRHVRIAESVLDAYIESCTVAPIARRRRAA